MEYLAGWSAARFYGVPYLETFFKGRVEDERLKHYVVLEKADVSERRNEEVSLISVALPREALRDENGVKVVSPELAYLQMCSELAVHEAILLGCLMCSAVDQAGAFMTHLGLLSHFAENAHRVRGRTVALRALPFVTGNFRSPVELMMYMMIALPNRLGGMGYLGELKANQWVRITHGEASYLGQQHLYIVADLVDFRNKVIFEYDGLAYHNDDVSIRRNERRREIFRGRGFRVYVFTQSNLYDPSKFLASVKEYAKDLHQTIRIQNGCFRKKFELLHDLLPRRGSGFDPSKQMLERNIFFWDLGVPGLGDGSGGGSGRGSGGRGSGSGSGGRGGARGSGSGSGSGSGGRGGGSGSGSGGDDLRGDGWRSEDWMRR